jgi:hypothetical protein
VEAHERAKTWPWNTNPLAWKIGEKKVKRRQALKLDISMP